MAHVLHLGHQVWNNYHQTAACNLKSRIELINGEQPNGRAHLKGVAETVLALLREARQYQIPVRPIGAGWSPSPINVVEDGWLVETLRLNRTFKIGAGNLHADCDIGAEALLLVQAGATVDEVYESAEELGRSLRTGGASNGQSFAGACATGTHGSVWQAGGIQDHVRAVQLVTPERILWIEPTQACLSDDFIAQTGSEIIRDDRIFAAALLHVGAMGFVTALLIETDPIYMVQNIQKAAKIRREHIDWLCRGEFRKFSCAFGLNEEPYFQQLILNPFDPFDKKALLRFLYKRPYDPSIPPPPPGEMGAGYDALTLLGKAMAESDFFQAEILQLAMEQAYPDNRDVDDPPAIATWGCTTEEHAPIASLFNGSVTIDRNKLSEVFDLIIDSFRRGGGGTVVTLRFVRKAKGLLAPARWPDNVVIDFDGPNVESSHRGYKKVVEALDDAGIAFTRHWGKTNNLNEWRVQQDYGKDFDDWKWAQAQVMPDAADRQVFANDELVKLGLI
ncbi:FAD-binding oxidoreductase [Parasphingorhabdus sp.]|uniref:FAD-binding oxidoreductase n=1 Tax=Parasphingorhabdus sp. TaxID=2709688 RepID=UPI003A903579